MYISVIIPALNEERDILSAINSALKAFSDLNIDGEVIIVNDGSIDRTEELVNDLLKKDNRIRLLKHAVPQGIGASFWDGVDFAKGDAVVMIPGDNENDPYEILRYKDLLEDVDIVIPFVFNKEDRPRFRNVLSSLYRFIINNTFLISLKYTNGTVLYRKSILLNEIKHRCKGFFYQTDVLVRLIKKGYLFAEVPYRLKSRKNGIPKAISFRSLSEVIKGYFRLLGDIYFKREEKSMGFCPDSVSARQYGKLNR